MERFMIAVGRVRFRECVRTEVRLRVRSDSGGDCRLGFRVEGAGFDVPG